MQQKKYFQTIRFLFNVFPACTPVIYLHLPPEVQKHFTDFHTPLLINRRRNAHGSVILMQRAMLTELKFYLGS